MKLKLLKPVVVRGHPGIAVGETFEAQPNLAGELLAFGFVEVSSERIETREPVIENRDPIVETPLDKPSKQRRSKKSESPND